MLNNNHINIFKIINLYLFPIYFRHISWEQMMTEHRGHFVLVRRTMGPNRSKL